MAIPLVEVLSSLYDYCCERGNVAFVQQLLDDETGGVPADPSSVTAPEPAAAKVKAKVAG